MFIPPRAKRGADKTCTRTPRMLSAVTIGAVALGATLGIAPSATADPAPAGEPLVVDIVGDSYLAGDGRADTYLDPALQALSRIASENPGLLVDANVVASSGAVTADFFNPQNSAQHHQIRPHARIVIVGFGGNDAELSEILAVAKPSNSSTPGDLYARIRNHSGLLDTSATDESYVDQATTSPLGKAPTLVSRLLQVLAAVANRAPQAQVIVTNYPLAVDPEDPRSVALIKKRDLVTVQKFVLDLNETIERAVRICACATLVDLTNALAGHEIYTADSAYAEPAAGQPHTTSVHPNDEGAARMADPLAADLASLLGIRSPKKNDGRVTVPENITTRSGEPDRDGDLVPDLRDEDPWNPHGHRQKHHRPDLRDVLGLDPRDDKPGTTPILTPPSPAPKRDSAANELPEHRKSADPDHAERKPAPRPDPRDRPRQIAEERDSDWLWREAPEDVTEQSEEDTRRIAPEEGFDSPAERPEGARRFPPEGAAEQPDRSAGRFAPEEPAAEVPAQEPATEAPAEEPTAEAPAREPAAQAPAQESAIEVPAQEPAAETPAEEPTAEAPVDEPAAEAPAEPVAEAPAEEPATETPAEEPVAEAPTAPGAEDSGVAPGWTVDEATDGQQICILIFPAPESCGGPSQSEGNA